ncbi:uncharacterized protein LOC141645948 [Silene latifolia]|uniref:uncharacterized protein LOC141645948 n=1 Tax=Silene latifolia TaxID=37657 RepID=UPI003D77D032
MKREYMLKNIDFSALELLRSVCYHKSVDCATMLLEGRSDIRIEVNSALEDGLYPLHIAATSMSPGLIDLFLLNGAQTDVQCKDSRSPYYRMYPLELALNTLRLHPYVSDWVPTKSIFKLIYIFCLPEMMGPLQAIEKLASKSDISVVQKISCQLIQEGKLVELSALLMMSWDMLVSPGHNNGDEIGSSFIVKYILSELQMLANKESKLVCCTAESGGQQQVRWKKGCLLFALSMLEILKRARAAIQDYRLSPKLMDVENSEVALDVSNLLKDLGFCLKNEDIDAKDVKGYEEVCYPMSPESLWSSLGGQSSRVFQIPNAEAFNCGVGIQSQRKPNRNSATSFPKPPQPQQPSGVIAIRRYWPRQPSSGASFATNRSWSFISCALRRCLRFSPI